MASLSQDIIEHEILTRLPLESLGRFKLVSRRWNSLISSVDFTKRHLQCKLQHSMNATGRKMKTPSSKHFVLEVELVDDEPVDHKAEEEEEEEEDGSTLFRVLHVGSKPSERKIVAIMHKVSGELEGWLMRTEAEKIVGVFNFGCLPQPLKDLMLVPTIGRYNPALVDNTLHWPLIESGKGPRILLRFDFGRERFLFSLLPFTSPQRGVCSYFLAESDGEAYAVGHGRATATYQVLASIKILVRRFTASDIVQLRVL